MFRRNDAGAADAGMDLFGLLALGFLFIVIVLIPFIADKKPSEESIQQGNVIIEMYWDDKQNIDVDLWILVPGDVPVGYSNLGGKYSNLLRDDLGDRNDISGKNMEIATTRGIFPGEYIVNAHLFSLKTGALPVAVRVVVSVKVDDKSRANQILARTVELVRDGHEKTVFRFYLDALGNYDHKKTHDTQINIRSPQNWGER